MAEAMNLSVKTVSTYRTRVLDKLTAQQQRPDLLRAEERLINESRGRSAASCRTRALAPQAAASACSVHQCVDLAGFVEHAAGNDSAWRRISSVA
jgi:DNA-binding NarL/FixJ family response regulator